MKVFKNTDEYLLSQFEKLCPDAFKYLNSRNPFARKSAESILWGFTIGFLVRHDYSEEEMAEFEIAVGQDTCLKCSVHDGCSLDPVGCGGPIE